MRMSGAREATTEQYFSSERSIARRALISSAPSPATLHRKWMGYSGVAAPPGACPPRRPRASAAPRAPSAGSAPHRSPCRSPRPRAGARRERLPPGRRRPRRAARARARRRRTPAPRATARRGPVRPPPRSVPPPRGEAEVEAVAPERIHGVILEEPVERGAVAELEADHGIHPQRRAGGVRAAAVVAGDAEPAAGVGHGGLGVGGGAGQTLEAGDVGVGGGGEPHLHRRANPQAAGEENAAAEPPTQPQLTARGHGPSRPPPAPQQPDAGAASRSLLHRPAVGP